MSTRIEIDLDAFRSNVRTLAGIVAPARTMLAVKADGYGHGMLPIARAALESGADSLAVLEVAEECRDVLGQPLPEGDGEVAGARRQDLSPRELLLH